jgi:hypothetical protein
MNWYADVFRKMHFDMHTPGDVRDVAVDLNAEALADAWLVAGCTRRLWLGPGG